MNSSIPKLREGSHLSLHSRHATRPGSFPRTSPSQRTQIFPPVASRDGRRGSECLPPVNVAGGEIYELSSGGLFSVVGVGILWGVVGCSSLYATWSMVQAFLSAAKIVNFRQDKPKREEEERQERIDKLFGKK